MIRYLIFFFLFSCNNTSQSTKSSLIVDNISTQPNRTQKTRALEIIQPSGKTIATRFNPPQGYIRKNLPRNSFAHYLRNFKLKPSNEKVKLYNGELKYDQSIHAAVLDIGVGDKDLQQCADATMRLRAEYLYQAKRYNEIAFNFTNGWRADYKTWRSGKSIKVNGNKTFWVSSPNNHTTRKSFDSYLELVFMYAGTLSLSKELENRAINNIEIGDIFIKGGSPGHAVIVVDIAEHEKTGKKLMLLAQSYMPAQQIHVVKNLYNKISPWYNVDDMQDIISTPEWEFDSSQLKHF